MTFFRQRPWLSRVSLLVGILLIVGGSIWWFLRPPGRTWDAGRAVEVSFIAFSPDGQLLASIEITSGDDVHPEVVLRRVPDGQVVARLPRQQSGIHALAFSQDGKQLASAGNGTVRIWTVADGRLMTTLRDMTSKTPVYTLAWSADGTEITTVSHDGSVRWWQMHDGTLLRTAQIVANFGGRVAINPQRELVAYTSAAQEGIWRAADSKITPMPDVFGGPPVFSADGQLVAGSDCTVDFDLCIWDVATGRVTSVFKGHTDVIESIAFSPDGTLIASGSGRMWDPVNKQHGDGTIRLWRVADGTSVTVLHWQYGTTGIAFSPDGKYLASGSEDHRIWLWNVAELVGKQ